MHMHIPCSQASMRKMMTMVESGGTPKLPDQRLEINAKHPIIKHLAALRESDAGLASLSRGSSSPTRSSRRGCSTTRAPCWPNSTRSSSTPLAAEAHHRCATGVMHRNR